LHESQAVTAAEKLSASASAAPERAILKNVERMT